jgi:3-phenylpropionate/trans-cinnamate dioxygenase ferredoxin reductase subunit
VADRSVDYLLIGGGLAAANCARWLREAGGSEESILLVGREPDPPYNRPPLSKGYMQGKESREETYFRPDEWWEEQSIDLLKRTSVTGLDVAAKTATLSTKEEVAFGQALLATGSNVRRLNVEGCHLEGIHYLCALGNTDAIRRDAEDAERVVLIGGSYIGTEVAASLTLLGKKCTIVMQEPVTLIEGFGETAGRYFHDVLESHGIEIIGSDALGHFEGDGDRVGKVVTSNGVEVDAELVVIGAGVTPEVTLAKAADLEIGERGGVRCDAHLRTSADGVFAAGDIAEYESPIHGRPMRIEHWDVAFNHGKTAALNMLGQDVPHEVVPYFFSDLADWSSMEYVGPASEWDNEVVRGSVADGEFSLWYLKDGTVQAALSVGRSDDLEHARRLLTAHTDVSGREAQLADLGFDLGEL